MTTPTEFIENAELSGLASSSTTSTLFPRMFEITRALFSKPFAVCRRDKLSSDGICNMQFRPSADQSNAALPPLWFDRLDVLTGAFIGIGAG
jgi:hypothetical protein